ncbi:hypothetical protein NQZ68_001573 [Dissostichus eleginoides]|nr:hypothetical protein NQZ68_001573 [Dissostichus eleginoides]
MWTVGSAVETLHHERAQCGEKQAKVPPRTEPLLLRRPPSSPSATVFTPISQATWTLSEKGSLWKGLGENTFVLMAFSSVCNRELHLLVKLTFDGD